MRKTDLLQETRNMRFQEVYETWQEKKLTQEEAAMAPGVCSRTFRLYINRYEEGGTESSFQGIKEVISKKVLFSSLYTDRGSHYWNTPEAGGKVDKSNLTQFGRAMEASWHRNYTRVFP